jgi:hypothetical protein
MAPSAAAAAKAAASDGSAAARRMAFFYVPNGVNMQKWTPAEMGTDFALTPILEPLTHVKSKVVVLTGLEQHNGFALGDGPGDHARSLASFLTGTHPLKTDGADIRAGISVDQVAAQKVGRQTRFASLELGCERGAQAGNCDSGYSCAYSSNISWRSATTPMAKEINPRRVFERLFATRYKGEADAARGRRVAYDQSVLDFVLEDADTLKNRLGSTDRNKLDEYLTSIRDLERRIQGADTTLVGDTDVGYPTPAGIPQDYVEHIQLMCDLIVLAFQSDLTRIVTFMFANEGSNRSYAHAGVPEGHHDLSHHGRDPKKLAKIETINRFHIEQFAYLLTRLDSIREGEGNDTLLDHSMIVYGSGIGDGNRHNHDDLPILLAGRGGGSIATGRHIKYRKTPLNNLYLTMLERMGAPTDSLGDSTGRLDQLD